MATGKITVRARVQVMLELDAGSDWDTSCPAEQVFRQAQQEVVQRLVAELKGCCSVIGTPNVIMVLAQETRP